MKNKIILLIALCSSFVWAQNKLSGFVFEDLNQNGKKERNEKGIQNVAVSNGVQVVLTDEKGRYELPLSGDDVIFVIKPEDYAFPNNEFNLPKFYHFHKPKGSPDQDFQYKAFSPTGKLPRSLDFALISQKEDKDFSLFVFGDPQVYNHQQVEYFEKAIIADANQNKEGIAFGISLGDLVGDDLDLHLPYKKAIQKLGLTWHNVMGNHDMNYEAREDKYSDETYELNMGPANYAFNYGNTHFIILDNILYPHPQTGKGYWGGFRKDQLEFLKNNLRFVDKDKLLVISFHIPLFIPGLEDHYDPVSRQEFLDLLQDFPHILLMTAHTHRQEIKLYTEKEGWKGKGELYEYNLGTTSGDWYSGELDPRGNPYSTMRDGTPQGYAFLNVKNNQYTLDYKSVRHSKDYQMEIYLPKVIADKGWNTARVWVNVFMGKSGDEVEFRVNQGEWKPMRYTEEKDPSYYHSVQKWDFSESLLKGRRPSNPVRSTHLWSAPMPNTAGVGTHTLEVRWTDRFGRTYQAEKTYRIETNN